MSALVSLGLLIGQLGDLDLAALAALVQAEVARRRVLDRAEPAAASLAEGSRVELERREALQAAPPESGFGPIGEALDRPSYPDAILLDRTATPYRGDPDDDVEAGRTSGQGTTLGVNPPPAAPVPLSPSMVGLPPSHDASACAGAAASPVEQEVQAGGEANGVSSGPRTIDLVREHLREHPWSKNRELAAELGRHENTITVVLRTLRSRGEVVLNGRTNKARWALAGAPPPAPTPAPVRAPRARLSVVSIAAPRPSRPQHVRPDPAPPPIEPPAPRHLPIVAIDLGELRAPEGTFNCKPLSAKLTARSCVARQQTARFRSNWFVVCKGCTLGEAVATRVGLDPNATDLIETHVRHRASTERGGRMAAVSRPVAEVEAAI